MTKKELISLETDKYMNLQRIAQAGDNWQTELNNQMMKARAKLESYGISVEPLTMKPLNS